MQTKMHRYIIEEALGLLKTKISRDCRDALISGCIDPDKSFRKFSIFSHYYTPGRTRNFFLINARDKGIWLFKKSLLYYPKDELLSFKILGRSLHYFADIASPAHTKMLPHLFGSDEFEEYTCRKKERFKAKKIIQKEDIPEYFDTIADLSSGQRCTKNDLFISLRYYLTGRKEKLSEKELKRQADLLIPLTISLTAGLIKDFIKNTHLQS